MYKSIGYWRLEAAFNPMEWGLPFAYSHGRGAFTFHVLCLELVWWRGEFRYTKDW